MKLGGYRFLTLFILILLTAFPAAGQRLPKPKRRESSLLMIVVTRESEAPGNRGIRIVVEGEQRQVDRIGSKEWDLLVLRLKPGEYTVHPAGDISENHVILPADTVLLAPFKLRIATEVVAEPNNEEDRQRAGRFLASYTKFPEWVVKDLKGFGLVRPALISAEILYPFSITSEPQGAQVYIDGLLMGQTPLSLKLPPGKKQLQFRLSGREDVIRYFNPDESDSIRESLPLKAADIREEKGTFTVASSPFLSIGETDTQLSSLFSESIMLVLEKDSRLSVGAVEVPWEKKGAVSLPDFSILESEGTDLVASGLFLRDDNKLTIQANLYDVRNETIKAGVRWSGLVGLDIFDAVDEISAAFEGEVDRVLPEAGKTLITRQETIYSGTSDDERLLARKMVTQSRRSWQHLLTINLSGDSVNREFTLDNGVSTGTLGYKEANTPFVAGLEWDWLGWTDYLGTMAGFKIINGKKNSEPATNERFTDYSLYGAVRLNMRDYRSDLYLGLGGGITFVPRESYTISIPVAITDDIGPFLNLSARMDLGFRGYLNHRAESRPVFWTLNMYTSLYEYMFDLTGDGNNGKIPVHFGLSIGMGLGL